MQLGIPNARNASRDSFDELDRRCGADARCGNCLPSLVALLDNVATGPGQSGPFLGGLLPDACSRA